MTVSDFYKEKFHTKVYKITLNAGCTCPTRDGTLATGGCIFCGEEGSGEFAQCGNDIVFQVQEAKKRVESKLKAQSEPKYIAYFQNFTNTYGNLAELCKKWETALQQPDVIGLALGTRPDCISEECLSYLSALSEKCFVQLELGLQTCCEKTAAFINRCYENQVYSEAVKKIREAAPKIHIVTHIIFGLPVEQGVMETSQQMMESVGFALGAGTHGIKITNLYIIKNTKLADLYKNGKIKVLERENYLTLLKQAVKIIPQQIVIHRLTGDPAKKDLIAPTWCADKKRMLNDIKVFCR